MNLLRSIVLAGLGLVLWAGAVLAQVPPTMRLCDGTVAGCPLIGAAALGGQPTAAAANGIQPVKTAVAASFLVVKGSPGNLYGIELTSGASAGYLMIFDATSAPADGTVTPVYAKAVAANSSIELNWTTPAVFTVGITAVFSTTGPFTKTASTTAFISGMAK